MISHTELKLKVNPTERAWKKKEIGVWIMSISWAVPKLWPKKGFKFWRLLGSIKQNGHQIVKFWNFNVSYFWKWYSYYPEKYCTSYLAGYLHKNFLGPIIIISRKYSNCKQVFEAFVASVNVSVFEKLLSRTNRNTPRWNKKKKKIISLKSKQGNRTRQHIRSFFIRATRRVNTSSNLIFQASLHQGQVPTIWKDAFITPLFKG